MKIKSGTFLSATAGLLMAGTSASVAQNASNEVWLGQTGDTNTIAIVQTGDGNQAGANASTLQINQDGRFNDLSIDQFGWSNQAGSQALPGANVPQGLNQTGDHNSLAITQHDALAIGSNFVGAVLQTSLVDIFELANRLVIDQSETGGSGEAGHVVGAVTQTNTSDDLGTNIARLTQSGGANGFGNTIERVIQVGYADLLDILQSQEQNLVGTVRQAGHNDTAFVAQGQGSQNTVQFLQQIGDLNRAWVTESGNRNVVESVLQNSTNVAISGNRINVTLSGDDNGGNALTGGLGNFSSPLLNHSGVFQGAFTQFGDDNDIRFTVNGGDENHFGVTQFGRGNGTVVAISRLGTDADSGARNEVAVFQSGDDNNLALNVRGSDNVAGISMDGDRNRLALHQTGNANIFDIAITGKDNNSLSPRIGGFNAALAPVAADAALSPGDGLQTGNSDSFVARISGNGNLFATNQNGDRDAATLSVSGNANQAVVNQTGSTDTAIIRQAGSGNSMAVVQF